MSFMESDDDDPVPSAQTAAPQQAQTVHVDPKQVLGIYTGMMSAGGAFSHGQAVDMICNMLKLTKEQVIVALQQAQPGSVPVQSAQAFTQTPQIPQVQPSVPVSSTVPQVPVMQPISQGEYPPGLAALTSKGKTIQELSQMYVEIKNLHPGIKHQGLLTILQSKLSGGLRGTPVEIEGRILTVEGPKTYTRKNPRAGQSEEGARSDVEWLIFYNNQLMLATMTFYDQDAQEITKKGPDGKPIFYWGLAYKMNVSLQLKKQKDEQGEEYDQCVLFSSPNTVYQKIASFNQKTQNLPTVVEFLQQTGNIHKLTDLPRLGNRVGVFVGYVGEIREGQGGFNGFMFNDQTTEEPVRIFINEPLLSMLSGAIAANRPFEGTKVMLITRVWIRQDGTPSVTARGMYPIKEE